MSKQTVQGMIASISDDQTRQLLKGVVKEPGWVLTPTKKGDLLVTNPHGDTARIHRSPSDVRAWLNTRAVLRRIGLGKDLPSEEPTEEPGEEVPMVALETEGPVDFGFDWDWVPEGPPPSTQHTGAAKAKAAATRAEKSARLAKEKAARAEARLAEARAAVAEPTVAEVVELEFPKQEAPATPVKGHATSGRKLRATTFDDLIEEEPPPRKYTVTKKTNEAVEMLLLEAVSQKPGKWLKLPDVMTRTGQKYLAEGGRTLGIKVMTRFQEVEGNQGYVWFKATEEN